MSKKSLITILLILVLIALGISGIFVYQRYFIQKQADRTTIQKEATHLSKVADTTNAYWVRGLPFTWQEIEKEKGQFDWSVTDRGLQGKGNYFSGDAYHLAMIWPYANWDQVNCHSGEKYKATGHLKESNEDLLMGKPCNMDDYANFLTRVVERYDGDGLDDMPGLKNPIKYWEIMNEPEMQGGSIGGAGEELKFFVGTPEEYLEILKTSYQTIKKADPEAKVAHAGMAGMEKNFQDFWDPIFAAGAGDYFDIANIHTISTDEKREDLYVIKFKKYLEKHGIKDKPIWITEVQFGRLMEKPRDIAEFNRLFVRASVFALAQGAQKLFYIENWLQWGDNKVYSNLVNKINSFEKIEILKEKYTEGAEDWQGATSVVGQYKFVNGEKTIYILWGSAELPAEINGKVKMTDIYGNIQEIDSAQIELSDSPIFVEKL